ncbi:ninjurin-2 isoform X3 [Cricetulus griseus]|uniref:Ninjurin-2 isoform X3 n=1 Tax=Cricetulus griseus TaxID=10029 RepID=A0A9J7GFU7_CRIGR|nr:ninjurin-2 isoform X3 [Cricetulus griseus]ERE67152.1 ninjurin-2-like protein [Cricetulus griseus]
MHDVYERSPPPPITRRSTRNGEDTEKLQHFCRDLERSVSQRGHSNPRGNQVLNMNHYATKKSVAESMLDVALFMSNATRLKVVLEQGPSSQYYTTLIALISVSLLLQIVIGILLVVIARLNLNNVENQWRLNQLNNAATTLVFITVVINIFITAFGAHKTGSMAARTSSNPV